MRRRTFAAQTHVASSILVGLLLPGIAMAQQGGVIERLQGDVRIIRAGQSMNAQPGHRVMPRDRIVSGPASAAGFTTPDNGKVSLGPNSQMIVDEIAFHQPTQDGNIAVRFLKGTFSAVTGLLGKISPKKSTYQTPTATIGIRGTEFSVRVEMPAELENKILADNAPGDKPSPGLDATEKKALSDVSVTIGLDAGGVDVKSLTGPVGLYREHRQTEANDFEAFKNQIRDGVEKERKAFEDYKGKIQREFVGYVESVSMKAGTEVVLSGNTAVERKGVAENPARSFMQSWQAGQSTSGRP